MLASWERERTKFNAFLTGVHMQDAKASPLGPQESAHVHTVGSWAARLKQILH